MFGDDLLWTETDAQIGPRLLRASGPPPQPLSRWARFRLFLRRQWRKASARVWRRRV